MAGPFKAPERPGFFDGRIRPDGTWLAFVYGWVRGFDEATGLPDIDLQAGMVRRR